MIDSLFRVGFISAKQKRLAGFLGKPFQDSPTRYLVARGGIEPPTQGFSILCSTD
jgi:hypothetical protein